MLWFFVIVVELGLFGFCFFILISSFIKKYLV